MSYEIVIFDASEVPNSRREFLAWFERVESSENDFRFPNADECTPKLKEYFQELQSYFPWRETSDSETDETEYEFGRAMLRCSFSWSLERKAEDTLLALCWRLKMGVYYIGTTGQVLFPNEVWDVMQSKSRARRPWWKIWRP